MKTFQRKITGKKIIVFLNIFFLFLAFQANAAEISDIETEARLNSIKIKWQPVNLTETESIILIRKEGACPKFYQDGQEIYRGNGPEYVDKNIEKNKKYCYGIYVYDFSGRSSEIKITGSVEKSGTGEYLAKILISENNYFIIIEIIIFLVLIWVNWKRRINLQKINKYKILRVDED